MSVLLLQIAVPELVRSHVRVCATSITPFCSGCPLVHLAVSYLRQTLSADHSISPIQQAHTRCFEKSCVHRYMDLKRRVVETCWARLHLHDVPNSHVAAHSQQAASESEVVASPPSQCSVETL